MQLTLQEAKTAGLLRWQYVRGVMPTGRKRHEKIYLRIDLPEHSIYLYHNNGIIDSCSLTIEEVPITPV